MMRFILRVHVLNNWVLRVWVIVIVVQILGKYMDIRYLNPQGYIIGMYKGIIQMAKKMENKMETGLQRSTEG